MTKQPEPVKRMTLSQVVERLLERGGSQHSSIDLGRTAGGKVTIGVSIRTSPDGEATTIAEAEQLAAEVYDRLAERYHDQSSTSSSSSGGDQ